MLTEKSIKIESEMLRDITIVVETYKLVAATSMRRIRGSVVSNREFHVGLNRVFQEIKHSYLLKPFTVVPRNNRTVLVLLSANTGLYGDVVSNTFRIFAEEAKKNQGDLVVIGRVGKTLLETELPAIPHAYFDFSDATINHDSLKKIYDYVGRYEKVVAFYGIFRNLFSQLPTRTVVSGETLPTMEPDKKRIYLFEPTFEKVALFFETEIFASLLEQVFYESRLAKLASRLSLLDRSSVRLDRESQKMFLLEQLFSHRAFNRKQVNALAGVSLWFG